MSRGARFTLEQVDKMPAAAKAQILAQLYPVDGIPDQADRPSPAPVVERDLRSRPLAKGQTQKGYPRKFLVRVTSFRRRLLDEDNLCEKYHVDCCRYAGLLAEDAPGEARIVTSQEKVARKEDERTEIEISPLD